MKIGSTSSFATSSSGICGLVQLYNRSCTCIFTTTSTVCTFPRVFEVKVVQVLESCVRGGFNMYPQLYKVIVLHLFKFLDHVLGEVSTCTQYL